VLVLVLVVKLVLAMVTMHNMLFTTTHHTKANALAQDRRLSGMVGRLRTAIG